jgi:hypothetical protein
LIGPKMVFTMRPATPSAGLRYLVLGAVECELWPDDRRRIALLVRIDEQAGCAVFLNHGVVEAGITAIALDIQDSMLQFLGVNGLVHLWLKILLGAAWSAQQRTWNLGRATKRTN